MEKEQHEQYEYARRRIKQKKITQLETKINEESSI